MCEVEHAGVDGDIVVTLLEMPSHHLGDVDTHRWMFKGRAFEVDVVIV